MQPLRIDFSLVRPLCEPSYPIHLDALVAWAAVREAELAGGDQPWSQQDCLPFMRDETCRHRPVWQASQLMFQTSAPPTNDVMTKTYEIEDFARKKDRVYARGPNKFPPGTGPYKGFLINVPIVWVPTMTAYAIGDADELRRLLLMLHGVGKYTRNGYGKIAHVTVTPDSTADTAWRYRTLPFPESGYTAVEATVRPPYWDRRHRGRAYRPTHIPSELYS